MKKKFLFILTLLAMMTVVNGCFVIEEVNNSINYVDKATDYINKMSTFAKEVPPLIEQVDTNPENLKQLETKLIDIQKEVKEFNQLTPPDFAKDIHAEILQHNQQLESAIDLYLNDVKNGKIDPSILVNTDLVQQIEDLSKMLEQIQNLGG